ncbi:MAG: right-handed parallel beta-helix repeat-containing protein [Promethearchaeota archaeon]
MKLPKKRVIIGVALGICVILVVNYPIIIENTIGRWRVEIDSNSELLDYFDMKIDTEGQSYFLLEGVSYSNIYAGIAISNTDSDIVIQNCDFSSGSFPIFTDMVGWLVGISLSGCSNIRLINCTFSDFQQYGIYLHSCSNISIINCTFVGNNLSNIDFGSCDYISIENSTFSGEKKGMRGDDSQNILIQHCRFSDMSQYGISLSYTNSINLFYNLYENIQGEDYRVPNCTNVTILD